MKLFKGMMAMLLISLSLFGCKGQKAESFKQISPQQAKQIMEDNKDIIILDTRTAEEFDEGHIENAICIDYTEIEAKAEKELPNKNQLILVYCRSGRRSKIAAETLVRLGYTNVNEFGGILDWPYEIIK